MLMDTTPNLRGIEMDKKQHKTVPAPRVLSDDPWFGPAVISDEAKNYLVQKFEDDMARVYDKKGNSKEPDNIHEVMYEMATKNAATTLQLDPIGGSENFQGGSENVHR